MTWLVFSINGNQPWEKQMLNSSANWNETLIIQESLLEYYLDQQLLIDWDIRDMTFSNWISSVALRNKDFTLSDRIKSWKLFFQSIYSLRKPINTNLKKKHFYYWITVVLFDPNESKMCFFNKNAILEQISIYYCLHILFIATLWIFKIKKSLQLSLRSSHSGMISKIVVLQLQSNPL